MEGFLTLKLYLDLNKLFELELGLNWIAWNSYVFDNNTVYSG